VDRLTFLGGIVAATVSARDAVRSQPVRLPENRPIEWRVPVLDGPDFVLSQHRGKMVFVTFFATWCPPCRREQPMFVDFAQAHRDAAIVLGVDVQDEDNDVRKWRKEFGVASPIAMDRRGVFFANLIPPRLFPSTIVFAADGFLHAWWYGTAGRKRLENVLAAKPDGPSMSWSSSSDDGDGDDVYTPGMKPSASPSPRARTTSEPG
jgi:thiol-disulfide isomerase/thioredoxin